MTVFALIDTANNVVKDKRDYPSQPPDIPHKNVAWLPIETVGLVPLNEETQVRDGPVVTVEPTRVLETYSIRDKTAQELDAEKGARLDRVDVVVFKALFFLNNEVRTIKGQAPLTAAQFKASIRSLL